eukprot:TRINITY_DN3693_c0_g1_i2.p1 TRINITY_DN3693_c0_g1~~TRINITY_DN3693_c0_g1_i2.p1  ORF type:complete len:722 (+),score=131.21 TRINITY_DN3693_c0_g1_i2:13-2178(+)
MIHLNDLFMSSCWASLYLLLINHSNVTTRYSCAARKLNFDFIHRVPVFCVMNKASSFNHLLASCGDENVPNTAVFVFAKNGGEWKVLLRAWKSGDDWGFSEFATTRLPNEQATSAGLRALKPLLRNTYDDCEFKLRSLPTSQQPCQPLGNSMSITNSGTQTQSQGSGSDAARVSSPPLPAHLQTTLLATPIPYESETAITQDLTQGQPVWPRIPFAWVSVLHLLTAATDPTLAATSSLAARSRALSSPSPSFSSMSSFQFGTSASSNSASSSSSSAPRVLWLPRRPEADSGLVKVTCGDRVIYIVPRTVRLLQSMPVISFLYGLLRSGIPDPLRDVQGTADYTLRITGEIQKGSRATTSQSSNADARSTTSSASAKKSPQIQSAGQNSLRDSQDPLSESQKRSDSTNQLLSDPLHSESISNQPSARLRNTNQEITSRVPQSRVTGKYQNGYNKTKPQTRKDYGYGCYDDDDDDDSFSEDEDDEDDDVNNSGCHEDEDEDEGNDEDGDYDEDDDEDEFGADSKYVGGAVNYIKVINSAQMVIPGLFISNMRASCDLQTLQRVYGITHVLSVLKSKPPHPDSTITYAVIPEDDVESTNLLQYFEACRIFIHAGRQAGGCLVHCMAGVSRSATLVLVYLMSHVYTENRLKSSLAHLKKIRPMISPNSGFLEQLKVYESLLQRPNYQSLAQRLLGSISQNSMPTERVLSPMLSQTKLTDATPGQA